MSYPGDHFMSIYGRISEINTINEEHNVDQPQVAPETDPEQTDSMTISGCPDRINVSSEQETPHTRTRVLLCQDEQTPDNDCSDLEIRSEMLDPEPSTPYTSLCRLCSYKALNISERPPTRICQTSNREGGIYYNEDDERRYDSRSAHASDTTYDGSVYFNYLQLANKGRGTALLNERLSESRPGHEPIKRFEGAKKDQKLCSNKSKHPKSVKTKKNDTQSQNDTTSSGSRCNFLLSCCQIMVLPSSKAEHQTKENIRKNIEICGYDSSLYSSPHLSSSLGLRNVKTHRKSSNWCRVKRLMLLVGILLTVMVILGGIVIGVIILAPHNTAKFKPTNLKEQHYHRTEAITDEPRYKQPIKDTGGWIYFSQGNGSYSGSRYTLINTAMTFPAAQEECRSYGGHLPFVNSPREQIFLEDFIGRELTNPDIQQYAIGFWLGARRARGSHSGTCLYEQWNWVDVHGRSHGIVNGFTAFGTNKPDNYFNPEECLYLSYSDTSPDSFLKWDDAPCDIPTIGGIKVICEVDDS